MAGLERTLRNIEALEPDIGAFACRLEPAEAHRQHARLAGPLEGLAVGVKDIFDTCGLPTAYGSAIYADGRPAKADAAMVGVIRRAGGLIIGKTTTTEFAYLNPTATRNPAAPGRTPGGSSAGSAAAVAAGMVPFAVGTQTGGSVIRPASYCGVAGFKPSFGWLPTAGLKCFSWSLDTVGLFARTVPEVARFGEAVTGHSLSVTDVPRAWRVLVADAYPWGGESASARRAVDRACALLAEDGVEVVRQSLPACVGEAYLAHDAIQGYEAWRSLAREIEAYPDALSPILRDYLVDCRGVSAAAYEAAQRAARQARAQCAAWFQDFDVLLTPSAPDEAPQGLGSTGVSTFNRAWTLLGLPCVNVPGLHGVSGAPMGLQVIAAYGADRLCLQAAARLGQLIASSIPSDPT